MNTTTATTAPINITGDLIITGELRVDFQDKNRSTDVNVKGGVSLTGVLVVRVNASGNTQGEVLIGSATTLNVSSSGNVKIVTR